jgi:hypothetical protein
MAGDSGMRTAFSCFLALFAVMASAPAEARARDDVMAGAFRCAAIADNRTWLDCYYGAAQPVRAQLGLPPAPASQTRLANSTSVGGNAGGSHSEVMSTSSRCYAIAEDRQWLDCYYAAAEPVRAALGLAPLLQARALPAQNTPTSRGDQQFGLSAARGAREIVSPLASYRFDSNGMFTLMLSNGQQWRQIAGDTSNAHWKNASRTYTAKITRGAFGSYNLQIQGLPGLYKVERLE